MGGTPKNLGQMKRLLMVTAVTPPKTMFITFIHLLLSSHELSSAVEAPLPLTSLPGASLCVKDEEYISHPITVESKHC